MRRLTANLHACLLSVLTTVSLLVLSSPLWSEEVNSITERRTGIDPNSGTGPAIGEHIPDFRATDQNGKLQDFATIRGPKGAVVYFHRSAAWCIYCRLQPVQL